MLRLGQVIFRRDKHLGTGDPPPLAAIQTPRIFAAGGAGIGQSIVIIAPRNAIGIGQMAGRGVISQLRRPNGLRADLSIGVAGIAHIRQQPLQHLDRIATRIDIHVKDRSLHRFGK